MSEAYSELIGQSMEGINRRSQDYFMVNGSNFLFPWEHRCDVWMLTNGADIHLHLPPVGISRGMFYSINLIDNNTAFDLLVIPANYTSGGGPDDTDWTAVHLDEDGANLLVYSDGRRWIDVGCSCGLEGRIFE